MVKKADVDLYGGYPSVNVKVYGRFGPSIEEITERFGCSEETAERALGFAWEASQQSFWEWWREIRDAEIDSPEYYFPGHRIVVYAEGRSGGHLVVHGLPDVESWDAIMLGKWAKFAREVSEDVKYRCSAEVVMEDIEANQWHLDGSELYNYVDVGGQTFTIPQIREAEANGRRDLFYATGR